MRTLTTLLAMATAWTQLAVAQTDSAAVPVHQRPRLLNASDIHKVLGQQYPRQFREAGIAGKVRLKIFVDSTGKSDSTYVFVTSGVPAFDRAARNVARQTKFAPALQYGTPIGTWLELPITFAEAASQSATLDTPPRLRNREVLLAAARVITMQSVNGITVGANPGFAFDIDPAGRVQAVHLIDTSCILEIDNSARQLAQLMEFSPSTDSTTTLRRTYATLRFGRDSVTVKMAGDTIYPDTSAAMRTSAGGATKPPELLNRGETARELTRTYPPKLRDRGVGGTVLLWLLLDESGRVTHVEISEPTEWCEFDIAALAVGRVMRFSPAMKNGTPVRVWIQIPVVWKTQ